MQVKTRNELLNTVPVWERAQLQQQMWTFPSDLAVPAFGVPPDTTPSDTPPCVVLGDSETSMKLSPMVPPVDRSMEATRVDRVAITAVSDADMSNGRDVSAADLVGSIAMHQENTGRGRGVVQELPKTSQEESNGQLNMHVNAGGRLLSASADESKRRSPPASRAGVVTSPTVNGPHGITVAVPASTQPSPPRPTPLVTPTPPPTAFRPVCSVPGTQRITAVPANLENPFNESTGSLTDPKAICATPDNAQSASHKTRVTSLPATMGVRIQLKRKASPLAITAKIPPWEPQPSTTTPMHGMGSVGREHHRYQTATADAFDGVPYRPTEVLGVESRDWSTELDTLSTLMPQRTPLLRCYVAACMQYRHGNGTGDGRSPDVLSESTTKRGKHGTNV